MKKISSFVLCALLMSCSFGRNEKSNASDAVKDSINPVEQKVNEESFNAELTYPGSKISFKVSVKGNA